MASKPPVHPMTGDASWAPVIRQARCADSDHDPDDWFPVSKEPAQARHEAAAAIAVCATCLVRLQCLELSVRHWDVGQHGVWGGMVAADRARLRHRVRADRRSGQRRRARNDRASVIAPIPRRSDGARDVQ